MSTNKNRLLHQLTRVTLSIWDCRGLLPNAFRRETWKTERVVALPFAIHGTGTRRFVEVYFYITGIILYISRPFLTDPFVSFSWNFVKFLLVALTGVVGSQMDCVLPRYFQWQILQDRARYTVYQNTCDMMACVSTIYVGIYVKLLSSIFDLYHS